MSQYKIGDIVIWSHEKGRSCGTIIDVKKTKGSVTMYEIAKGAWISGAQIVRQRPNLKIGPLHKRRKL